jgi:probable rRNA maturation factor
MLELAVEADSEWDSSRPWPELARKAAAAAIAESAFPQLATARCPVEISLRLAGDEDVRVLNAEWRGRDKPTNVLSFPMLDPDDLHNASLAGRELLLGDIILAHGICASEAADKSVPVEQHAIHLIVHGTLHLLGYDHLDDAQAADMEGREVRALERLGIANPYEVAA